MFRKKTEGKYKKKKERYLKSGFPCALVEIDKRQKTLNLLSPSPPVFLRSQFTTLRILEQCIHKIFDLTWIYKDPFPPI